MKMNYESSVGYLLEVFSSFQGEGGTVRGSCFGKKQIFIRFAGCNIAHKQFGTSGCFFCDTPEAQSFEAKKYQYEKTPSTQIFSSGSNPIEKKHLLRIVNSLISTDLHSISFTGGEPLCQLSFLLDGATALKKNKIIYPLYLETNGSILPNESQLSSMSNLFTYCCCDLKDKSSYAAEKTQWKKLVQTELTFIKTMISINILTFAKLVVTSETKVHDIEWLAQKLSKIRYSDGYTVGLAIQPVYLTQQKRVKKYSVSHEQLNRIFSAAAQFLPLESLTLSIQAHKFLDLL
ncbi:MAG: putative 7-carboxy-7-deazaguanine synthase [Promethearchaeota archaeon]|nr:MAG: putative 7-carboxy-7-deazaguanine synthase [Candidatus Lokiarchaeota archaeon]